MNIDSASQVFLNNTEIIRIIKNGATIWEKVAPDYFYIQNEYNGTNTFTLRRFNNSESINVNLEYSKDKQTWTQIDITKFENNITLNSGEKLYLRNNSGNFSTLSTYFEIDCSQNYSANGNINSLINYNNINNVQLSNYCFYKLFNYSSKLIYANNLVLPSLTMKGRCYKEMFYYCSNLTSAPSLPATTMALECYYNMFQFCSSLTTAPNLPAQTLANSCYFGMFMGCTSLTTAPIISATTMGSLSCCSMFNGCTALTTAPTLPATTMATECYEDMFLGCTALTTAPTLPATNLANKCYFGMFSGCTALTTAPIISATTMASECCEEMFYGCNHLTTAPTLSSMTMEYACYANMFNGCTALTTAPTLPATTLADSCYYAMFANSGLTQSPQLPALTMVDNCYKYMFYGCSNLATADYILATATAPNCCEGMYQNCTSLTIAPKLRSQVLSESCYNQMFKGCTALTTSSALYALTLANYCYYEMFEDCSSLTTVRSRLPATTLYEGCYGYMFKGCTSLVTAPELPAKTLVDKCYIKMFAGCSSLQNVITYADDISATDCTYCWLQTVGSNGTLYNIGSATYSSGVNGLPSTWSIGTLLNNLYIENTYYHNNTDNKVTITTTQTGSPTSGTYATSMQYSKDRINWTTINFSTSSVKNITLYAGERIYFRNGSGYFNNWDGGSNNYYTNFNCQYSHDIGGNPKSLLNYNNMSGTALTDGCFTFLFNGDTNLVNANKITISNQQTIAKYAYRRCFNGCTSLVSIPSFTNTTKVFHAGFNRLFYGCTSLTTGINIKNVTQIDDYALGAMYQGCSSLTEATAPNISTWDTAKSNNWLSGVAASGVVKKPSSLTITSNSPSGVPSGWTTQNY